MKEKNSHNKREIPLINRLDLLLLVILGVLLPFLIFGSKTSISSVEVIKDGSTVMHITEPGIYSIVDENNVIMRIVYEDSGVFVKEASCPNKICERMGRIKSGIIVCVPNKVIIRVIGRSRKVDAMTW